MEAKELRIGNLLYLAFAKKNVVVFGIDVIEISEITHNLIRFKDGINFSVSKIELFEPILLTEEWLLNFNFELKSMVNGKVLVYRNNMLAVSFNTDNKIISIHIGIQRIDDGKKIKYVHQIQNLYFDLTGQELFIKNQE